MNYGLPDPSVAYRTLGIPEGPVKYSDDDAFQGMLLELADPWTRRDDDGGERLIWTAYCGMNMEIFRVPYLFN